MSRAVRRYLRTVVRPRTVSHLAVIADPVSTAGEVRSVLGRYLPARARTDVALALLAEQPDVALTFERAGLRWTLPLGDVIVGSVLRDGSYQGAEMAGVLDWLGRWTTRTALPYVVDVGANTGTTSVPLAVHGYRVLALEPVPRTFAYLERNVRDNDLGDKVICVDAAVSRVGHRVEMVLGGGLGESEVRTASDQRTLSNPRVAVTGSVEVRAAGLDELVAEAAIPVDQVAFVWSDSQGSEGDVVATGELLWTAGTPLFAELWPAALARRIPMDAFHAAVEARFSHFIVGDDLARDRAEARPELIQRLRDRLGAVDREQDYIDALLLPTGWDRADRA